MNWNSKAKEYSDVKNLTIKQREELIYILKYKGMSVKDIAEKFGISKSRVYEHLKKSD